MMKKMLNKRIAIYNGPGVSLEHTIKGRWKLLAKDIDITIIQNTEFTEIVLKDYDLVILPGGSGRAIIGGLGDSGVRALHEWVFNGGKLIGVCAGMFAIVKDYKWSMGFINFTVVDKPHWVRGDHPVDLKITTAGKKFLNIRRSELKDVPYHNGPIVQHVPIEDTNISNEIVIAEFETNWPAVDETIHNAMIGAAAIIKTDYGKGTVVASSPHLEAHKEYKKIIAKLIKILLK